MGTIATPARQRGDLGHRVSFQVNLLDYAGLCSTRPKLNCAVKLFYLQRYASYSVNKEPRPNRRCQSLLLLVNGRGANF